MEATSVSFKEKLKYLKLAIFHPMEGFYDIRFRGKGSILLSAILLCFYGLTECAAYQYTGFILNENNVHTMNSISIFLSHVFIVVLCCVANWTVTTLFNGKGNMASIFNVVCYSLFPYSVMRLIVVFLSNFIIKDEAMLIYMISGIGIVWFVFLVVAGLCVIHEYGLFQNLASLVVTAVSAFLIVFLLVLFLTLEEQMFGFIKDVFREFVRRFTL